MKILSRGLALGKEMVFLNFFNPLPRAYSLALGKEIVRIFFQKNLCRGLLLGPSAKDPSLPRALVIALGKEADFFFCFLHSIDTSISYIYIYISHRTHFLTIYHNHNCEPQITIYYNDKSHVHHHSHVYYDKLMKSKHKSQP